MLGVGRPGIVTGWSELGRRIQTPIVRGVERRVHDADDVAADRGHVDLVAQALGEVGRGSLGVVAGAVEAVVDRGLDAPPERLEQGGGEERGAGHGHGLAPDHVAEDGLEQEDRRGVDGEQRSADHGPRQAAADEPVDLVQAVAHHGDADGDRWQQERQRRRHPGDVALRVEGDDDQETDGNGDRDRAERRHEPAQLQPFQVPRAGVATGDRRDGRDDDEWQNSGADRIATEGRARGSLRGRRPIGFGNSTMLVPPVGSRANTGQNAEAITVPQTSASTRTAIRRQRPRASLPVGKENASVANRANVSDTAHFGQPGDGHREGRRGQGLQLVRGGIDRQERHGERPAHAKQHPADDVPRPSGDEDRTDARVWHVRREEDDQGESPRPSREEHG